MNDMRIMFVFIPALLLMVAILCFLAAAVYQKVSERTVTNISGVYLREMTTQLNSHFRQTWTASFPRSAQL